MSDNERASIMKDRLTGQELVGIAMMAIGMWGLISGVDHSGWLIFLGALVAVD